MEYDGRDGSRVLRVDEARAYYDRFGAKQDTQGFYEDPALADMIAHADFEHAASVFEFGCGTGKLAERLLARHLPDAATYTACDVSPVMVRLATERLSPYAARARVRQSGGSMRLAVPDRSSDRVVSSYVLDLLSHDDAQRFVDDAHRALAPGGRLCLVSLTEGANVRSRIVAWVWRTVFRAHPSLVGGCRPIRLEPFLAPDRWAVDYRAVRTPWGVPSEVVVARAV
jgi:ubiquinone/menaquinone biosynthesis C-methylase UbiE